MRWSALTGVVLAFLVLGGCRQAERNANVLLITVDTLRPDAIGAIDPRRDTPEIDALAANGRLFSAAVSAVPLTLPSHTSILSGMLPVHHGVRDNGQTVPSDVHLMQEVLRAQGYRTGAFVSGFPLQAMFGLDRGFDHYDDTMLEGEQGWIERKAEDTVKAATDWLDRDDGRGPWFTWAHFYDPHDPYEPPREFWQPGPRGAYDGEVTYADYWIGNLIEAARKISGNRPLLIVLTADHGEALGEHDEQTHGYYVYDSTMRVPLVFSWPGTIAPARGDEAVQLIDIAPTVLALLGKPDLGRIDGKSLADGLTGGNLALHPALMETWLPWTYYGWAPLSAWLDKQWKLVDAPVPELYDLTADPHEAVNVVAGSPAVADRLGIAMDTVKSLSQRVAATSADETAMQRLRSLGYVGVGAPVETPPDNLADPKSRVVLRDRLKEGEGLLRAGHFAAAQDVFASVLVEDPDSRYATLRSGIALLRLGRIQDSARLLRHAVELEPHRSEARYALGDALMRNGDFALAADQWAALAELQPRRKEAWFNLSTALKKTGQGERAKSAMEEFHRLESSEEEAKGTGPTP